MGFMFRSEEVAMCQLYIQPEAAYSTVSELGELGLVQFRDLNENLQSFQRKYISEVRRCDEMERKLCYIEAELKKDEVTIPETKELPRAPNPREMIDLEAHLEKIENEILELSYNNVNLKSNFLELTELINVLNKTENFFENHMDSIKLGGEDETANRGQLDFVAGVIPKEKIHAFEKMLFRISRGNIFVRQADFDEPVENPTTGQEVQKAVFVAFFQGVQLKNRVQKVCSGFHASLYPCPHVASEREDMRKGVRTRLADLEKVLNQTKDHRQRVLVGASRELSNRLVMVRKMKAIFHVLNQFNNDVTHECMIAECWIPYGSLDNVRECLKQSSDEHGCVVTSFLNIIETKEVPPTFNRSNKFTRGFQNLIDSYGVASYREINPALYTIITFPFLFAVMFGDVGHGLIMFLFAAYVCLKEKTLVNIKGEIWSIFFGGRYIILLMGLFSIYTGFIYNDLFSKSMNIFGSGWKVNYNRTFIMAELDGLTLNPSENADHAYPFGVDPVWQLAPNNKIIFQNSFKMKLSIIFGVTHMIFAICIGVINHVHFKRKIYILLEFLPQITFLVLLFGYMVFMMFMKWIQYTALADDKTEQWLTPGCAPSVLILFINMVMFGSSEVKKGCREYMFEGQKELQMALLIVAVLCIPVMLLGKPFYIMAKRKREAKRQALLNEGIDNPALETDDMVDGETSKKKEVEVTGGDDHDNEPISEVFIYQTIHTIEFVLNCVSHTASYLRLWALSLAHAQLSDVLWNRLFHIALMMPPFVGGPVIYIFFYAWAALTIFILVMMEGLSAFLHTLRLHWVEFMSKFYAGLGYLFEPFCFKTLLAAEDEED